MTSHVLHRLTVTALALGALTAATPEAQAADSAPERFDIRIFYSAPGRAPAVAGIRVVPSQPPTPVPDFSGAAAAPTCTAELAGPAGLRQAVVSCDGCHVVLTLSEAGTGSGSSGPCGPGQGSLSVLVHPVEAGAH